MSLKLVALIVLQLSALVLADEPANCTAGWSWASNSLGQNPCEIAGALEAPCRNLTSFVLGPLAANNTYTPPPKGSALDCECNTVMYSLFMACTACQGVTDIDQWSVWDANCASIYVSQYPGVIPVGTAVPHWAYLNVTLANIWSATDSETATDNPESSGAPIPTATVSGSSSTSPGSHTTGNAAGASGSVGSNSSGSKSSSNAGAIAGGVVGGLAALGIIAGLVTWFLVRKRRNAAASGQNVVAPNYEYTPAAPYSPTPHSEPQMKLYNPNDPSSFPVPVGGDLPSLNTSNSGNVYPSTLYDPSNQQRGRYTGAPEL